MKQTLLLIQFILLSTISFTQNTDSLLAEPQIIELIISTPQPRLKETFQLSIDISHLRANIFKSLIGKIQLSTDGGTADNTELSINVNALKKGSNEIGPLEFFLDKTQYTTNKITYEVVDPLPDTDKGIWFRKVIMTDSTFCIIIEQRIPASSKRTINSDSSVEYTTEPSYKEIAKLKNSFSVEGLRGSNSHSHTNYSQVTLNGEDRQFMYSYGVYYFEIENKTAKIKITKDKFENLPGDYKFEDIIIQ